MSATELGQQRVNGPDLHSATATGIPHLGGFDVVLAVGHQERQGREALHKQISRLGSGEALKKFLKCRARREHLIGAKKRVTQS